MLSSLVKLPSQRLHAPAWLHHELACILRAACSHLASSAVSMQAMHVQCMCSLSMAHCDRTQSLIMNTGSRLRGRLSGQLLLQVFS